MTSPSTAEALFVVEGHHDGADRDVKSALADHLVSLLASHQPCSSTESWALSLTNPRAGTDGGAEAASRQN